MIYSDFECDGEIYNLYVPGERFVPPFPLLIQLHGAGGGDDHIAWTRWGDLERHAEGFPLIVAMPSGILCPSGRRLACREVTADLLADRLPSDVAARFPGMVKAGRWGIGGLSFGAHTAMRLAFAYPERFGSVWGHSGYYDAEILSASSALARSAAVDLQIGLDCGLSDPLLRQSRGFKAHLDGHGLSPEYCELRGRHDWAYWRDVLPIALRHHAVALA